MIVLLKMHASGRIFDNIYLKAIRDTFFFNIWSAIRRQVDSTFWWWWYSTEGKVHTFWLAGRLPPLILLLSGTFWSPHKKNLRRVLDLLTGMILKRVYESIFSEINKITPSLKIKKRWQIFWYGIQSTEDYPSISR